LKVGVVEVFGVGPASEAGYYRQLREDYDPASARNVPPFQYLDIPDPQYVSTGGTSEIKATRNFTSLWGRLAGRRV
jgi:hypothetical protein